MLSENFTLPGYNKVAAFRSQINLISEVHLITETVLLELEFLTQTVDRVVSSINVSEVDYPLKIKVSNGLDGSGCHRVHRQVCPNSYLSTKNFLLFGFEINSILNIEGSLIWKDPSPNSPYSTRPVIIFGTTRK